MTRSLTRAAWIALSAVCGGTTFAVVAGLLVTDSRPTPIATAWFVGASLGALVAWSEPFETADVRFTRDAWSVLGWLCVFLLPVVGIALGLLLRARGSRQGLPMVVVSVAAIGLYALLVQIV